MRVAGWLRQTGHDVAAYFADLPTEDKEQLERRLLANDVKALVATVALGMGFDKPDLGFVIHYQRPGSIVAYYQQIGRAGRALDDAVAVLLNGREDDDIHDYFIGTAFPGVELLEDVLGAVEANPGIRTGAIERLVNARRGKIEQALKFLEIDRAVYRERGGYFRTPNAWTPDLPGWAAVTERRERELTEMKAFAIAESCLMELVTRALDDPHAAPCGRCANCAGPVVPSDIQVVGVQSAIAFLRRAYRPIQPRKQWPADVGPGSRTLPFTERAEQGRALSVWGDAGWGSAVRTAKYEAGRFDDDLVEATAAMIRAWNPRPRPEWVTAVPSLRHPDLVPDFARRLATAVGLPFHPVLVKVRDTAPQKSMENSQRQAANVYRAFDVLPLPSHAPVLLVDDIVDSVWTFTECARVLRRAGVAAVLPVALAEAGPSWRGDA
jgi:ATP-dependent DNA helicase RecQ